MMSIENMLGVSPSFKDLMNFLIHPPRQSGVAPESFSEYWIKPFSTLGILGTLGTYPKDPFYDYLKNIDRFFRTAKMQ